MPSTPQKAPVKRIKWDAYVKEAAKPPFEIDGPDGLISISEPSGQQMVDAQALASTGDIREQMRLLCGDAADEMMPLLMGAPGSAVTKFVSDLMEHFGFTTGEAPASSN